MSILMPSNSTDFKALAAKVVDEHVGTGKTLEECVAELAESRDFTPEEIKRLVEKSNTEMALRHLKGDSKKENFALAKFENVLRRTHGSAGDSDEDEFDDEENSEGVEKTAEYNRRSGGSVLPNTRRSGYGRSGFYGIQKTAMLGMARYPREIDSGQYYAMFDGYEKAKFEKSAAELRIQENFDWLVRNAARWKESELTKFASDVVMAHRGNRPHVLLKHIGVAAGRGDLSKYATERPSYTDDSSEAVRRIASIYSDIELFTKKAEETRAHEIVLAASNEAIKRTGLGLSKMAKATKEQRAAGKRAAAERERAAKAAQEAAAAGRNIDLSKIPGTPEYQEAQRLAVTQTAAQKGNVQAQQELKTHEQNKINAAEKKKAARVEELKRGSSRRRMIWRGKLGAGLLGAGALGIAGGLALAGRSNSQQPQPQRPIGMQPQRPIGMQPQRPIGMQPQQRQF